MKLKQVLTILDNPLEYTAPGVVDAMQNAVRLLNKQDDLIQQLLSALKREREIARLKENLSFVHPDHRVNQSGGK